jgi:hypothetical protein
MMKYGIFTFPEAVPPETPIKKGEVKEDPLRVLVLLFLPPPAMISLIECLSFKFDNEKKLST